MCKSIVIVDTPKSCGECTICASWQDSAFSVREYWCPIAGNKDVNPRKKPNWCPLKPLPKKMLVWHDDSSDDYEEGYNQCLREIVGKQGEDEDE